MAVETIDDLTTLIDNDPAAVREALELVKRTLPNYPVTAEALDADVLALYKDATGGTEQLQIATLLSRVVDNSGGVQSLESGIIADRPPPGNDGAWYIATDEPRLYRDDGSAWIDVLGTAAGRDVGTASDEVPTNSEIDGRGFAEQVDSVSALQSGSYPASLGRIWLSGYYGIGTPGGGPLYRDSSDTTTADNGGTVFVDADGVRWKRPDSEKGVWMASWFGASTDRSDNENALQTAIDAAPQNGVVVEFGTGTFDFSGAVVWPEVGGIVKPVSIHGQKGHEDGIVDSPESGITAINYTGDGTPSAFWDFIGSSGAGDYRGGLRDIHLFGNGASLNGVRFYDAKNCHFNNVNVKEFGTGFFIENDYYYSTFFEVNAISCSLHGFSATGLSNGASFYGCNFSKNAVAGARIDDFDSGVFFFGCYFENNQYGFYSDNFERICAFYGCYFEGNSDNDIYLISNTGPGYSPILDIDGCFLKPGSELTNKYSIQHDSAGGVTLTVGLKSTHVNNVQGSQLDALIQMQNGDIIIDASNVKLADPSTPYPLVSNATPVDSRYFNVDMST